MASKHNGTGQAAAEPDALAAKLEALQAVADAARDVMAAVKYGVRGRMAVCPTPRVAALEAALAKLEETTC